MKTAARKPPLLLLVLLLAGAALLCPFAAPSAPAAAAAQPQPAAAATAQRDLLAHGTDKLCWSADVVPTSERRGGTTVSGVKTFIRMRSTGQAQWREITTLFSQARDLANRGDELLVTTADDGAWQIVSDDGARTGNPLPGGARILALCGDEDDVWAIGEAPKGQVITIPPPRPTTKATTIAATTSTATTTATTTAPAATNPATESTSPAPVATDAATESTSTTRATTKLIATTNPATSPAPVFPPHEVGLFLLQRGQWTERDVLPGNLHSGDVQAVSMAMVDRRLMLAAAGKDSVVRVWSRDASGHWDAGGEAAVLGEHGKIKLMNLDGRPALWVANGNGSAADPGELFIRRERWGEPIKLVSQPKLASFDRRTLTVAFNRIRLLASDGRGQLKEQLYNADGSLNGEPLDATTVARSSDDYVSQIFQLIIVVVLIIWMFGSMRQRPAVRRAVGRVEELHLAPLGRRFVGGLIDLIPLIIGSTVGEHILQQSAPPGATSPPPLTIDSPAFAWMAAGMGVYLLLTCTVELITRGRSIGKLIAGTRVAALDGSRASAGALLVRNLLRLIDIILVLPLSFVLFSPLRQRVGDMAGGTIVISNDAPEVAPSDPEPERDSDDDDS